MIPLEYQTPEPPSHLKPLEVIARFGAGLVIGSLIDLTLSSYFGKQDFDVCDLLGLLIWALIFCGMLWLGLWIRQRKQKVPLAERKGWLSVGAGVAMATLNVLILNLLGHLLGDKYISLDLLCLAGMMIGSAWIVFGSVEMPPLPPNVP